MDRFQKDGLLLSLAMQKGSIQIFTGFGDVAVSPIESDNIKNK